MRKKGFWILAGAASLLLAAAGVAGATHSRMASAQSAKATFDAAAVSGLKQVTCSIAGGDSFEGTAAKYTGTAISTDPRLSGALTVWARSVVDTTTGLGRVSGVFKIVDPAGGGATGHLSAVVESGQANGLAKAELRPPWGHLVATLSSGFDPNGGFSNGSLGSSSKGAGVVISGGYCRRAVTHPRRHG